MATYIVDVDGTVLATHGTDYKNSVPYLDRIAKINRLYDVGHTIIYWTARGSVSGIDYLPLTKEQLDKWGAKYHEVKVGKPVYDYWIDDKAFNSEDFFQI